MLRQYDKKIMGMEFKTSYLRPVRASSGHSQAKWKKKCP